MQLAHAARDYFQCLLEYYGVGGVQRSAHTSLSFTLVPTDSSKIPSVSAAVISPV